MKSVLAVTLSAVQMQSDGSIDLFFRNSQSCWCVGHVKKRRGKRRVGPVAAAEVIELAQDEPDAIALQPRNIDIRRQWQNR